MGINGLLPLLKSIQKPCNLKRFDGKTLAVDAYGWLHRGTVACAMELAMGKPTRRFVDFAMHRVRMLQHFGVTPYLVFDGDYLPSKAATEADRTKRREESRRSGLDLLNAGKTSQAYLEFQKAVDVTPEMARQLIDDLKKAGVKYVVAPYEADAQMVYLERKGIIDGILSEDSDLLVFGAKCLLTKLDQYGNCIEINKADFCAVKEISLTGWSDVEFRTMAILSGCDYLASINNMGLKTAYRMVRKHKNIEKIIRMLQFDGKFSVPKNYLEAYHRAELTFLHQRVFCPEKLQLVYHTEPEQPLDDANMSFLGVYVEPEVAQGVARGDLNPITKLPIRSKMIASNSPFSSATRSFPQRAASFVEAPKKDKEIGAYFKAKRIPLAELDVNCFTPSPSQQDALRRNSGPWSASPTPRPYLNRSANDLTPQTRSLPSPDIQQHVSQPDRAHFYTNISAGRPTKRARLCEEIDIATSSGQSGELRSRFFGGVEPSPSATNTRKGKKSKKNDITIFSDDSIEEAMLSIAESKPKEQRDVAGLEEEALPAKSNMLDTRESQSSSQSDTPSQDSIFTQTTSFSTTSSTQIEASSTPVTSAAAPSNILNLKDRFSAKTTITPKAPATLFEQKALPTPRSTFSKPSRIPLAVKPTTTLSSKQALTPLQRLGMSAANSSRLPFTPPMTPVTPIDTRRNHLRSTLPSKESVPFPEVVEDSIKHQGMKRAVEPAMIPLPPVDDTENAALRFGNGSEDFIIHDSEEEEPLSPIESVLPKIDLRRFAFSR